MAYPTPWSALPVPPGSVFKVTFFLNGPNCGITETWYLKPNTTDPSFAQWDNIAAAYAAIRQPVLTPSWSLVGYRYIDVTQPRGGELRVPSTWPYPGTYNGASNSLCDNTTSPNNVGMQFRITDASRTIRKNEIFRGIPQAFLANSATTPNKLSQTGVFTDFVTRLNSALANLSANPNLSAAVMGAKFVVRDPAVNKPAIIETITTGANNWLQYTTRGINNGTAIAPDFVVPPWAPGTKILIGGLRQKCSRKLNGVARVVSVTTLNTTPVTYQVVVCKPNCCLGTPILCPQAGSMQLALYNYCPLTAASPQIIAERKTGRPFRLRPGRRQQAC